MLITSSLSVHILDIRAPYLVLHLRVESCGRREEENLLGASVCLQNVRLTEPTKRAAKKSEKAVRLAWCAGRLSVSTLPPNERKSLFCIKHNLGEHEWHRRIICISAVSQIVTSRGFCSLLVAAVGAVTNAPAEVYSGGAN